MLPAQEHPSYVTLAHEFEIAPAEKHLAGGGQDARPHVAGLPQHA